MPTLSPEFISTRILQLRHQRVMLATDLAELYGLPTKRPNEPVERKWETQDQTIANLIKTIRTLMTPPEIKKRPIGFIHPDEN